MAEHTHIVDRAIATVDQYNKICAALQKVIHSTAATSVDCPVISQVFPEINEGDPSQNTLCFGYYPYRGSRTERYIHLTREELEKALV